MQKRAVLILLSLLLATFVFSSVDAQDKSLVWNRWDVNINNVDVVHNSFDVTESYDIDFSGSFYSGEAVIPLTNLNNISNVSVSENGTALQESSSQDTGTFYTDKTSDGLSIEYYFLRRINNASAQFQISYHVDGALRVYSGGDQLWWIAIPSNHYGFPVENSTITVEMPQGYAPREGVDSVETYGAAGTVNVKGTTITATANQEITDDQTFEIRVQYPHAAVAVAPSWQGNFDTQRAYDEKTKPLVDIGLLVLSLVIGIGGTLAIYARWYTKGRDPQIGPVPKFLTEPPDTLSPAIVGTLIDEKADVQDVISILVDLAHRGYLVMEESQDPGLFGIGATSKFTFKRTDKADTDLKPYEKRMLNSMFSLRMERTMDSMRNTFYTVISALQSDLYKGLVDEGLFTTSPQVTRFQWSTFGIILMVVAGIFVYGASQAGDTVSNMLILVPLSIGFVGLVTLIAGNAMPAKTRKGAEEAAKWRAFYEYLQNLEKYSDVAEASKHFDDFLPYAVAFGLDNTWVRRFSAVPNVPIPYWYYPTYLGGPYHGGYIAGSPLPRNPMGGGGMPGPLAHAGGSGVSLDSMSHNMTGGLQNISKGLTGMLNSASRVMTSQPQSSSGGSGRWSSGGRGWSGGGGFGGGGSGGGSRGFR